jgi:hypothetical protein
MEKLTEADTCRKYVLPKPTEGGLDNEPHSSIDQSNLARGQLNSFLPLSNHNISGKLKRIPAVAFFATAAAHGKI